MIPTTIRRGVFTLALGMFPIGTAIAAAQTPPPTAAAPQPEAKSPAGKWTLTIDTPIGAQTSALTIAVDGEKVTGSVTREDRQPPNPIAGRQKDGAVSFTMTWNGANGPLELTFEGKIAADGTLGGTCTLAGTDPVEWRATRAAVK